jgi:hypothetical protein
VVSGSPFPFRSELRTREQMEWIHDRYKVDALERLARSTPDYYNTHGNYLPDVSALAHAAIREAQRLHAALAVANKALDALATTLELHAEDTWAVEAHGIACTAWRVTEDALGRKAEGE